MTPKEMFEVDEQIDQIMNNIMDEDSLCVIRDALTLFFSTQDDKLADHRAAELERPMFSGDDDA